METEKLDEMHKEKCGEFREYKGKILLLISPEDSCHAYWVVGENDSKLNSLTNKAYVFKGGQI